VAPLGLTHAQYAPVASLYGMQRAGERPSRRRLADHTGLEPLCVSKLAPPGRAILETGPTRAHGVIDELIAARLPAPERTESAVAGRVLSLVTERADAEPAARSGSPDQ
jgi:hypothetical protein